MLCSVHRRDLCPSHWGIAADTLVVSAHFSKQKAVGSLACTFTAVIP